MKKKPGIGKRLILLAAAAAMILSGITGAQAGTLKVAGELYDRPRDMQWYKDWVRLHPRDELKVSDNFIGNYKNTAGVIKALEARNAKHSVIIAPSFRADWKPVRDTGLLADLSGSEELVSFVKRMYPVYQEMAYENGRLAGIPCAVYPDSSTGISCCPEGWEKAGYGKQDVPGSFLELLDFLESWIERNRKEPTGLGLLETYMFENFTRSSYTYWLCDLFADQYANECLAQGNRPVFSTPENISLMERIARIGADLYDIEPKENPYRDLPWNSPLRENFSPNWILDLNGWSLDAPYVIPSRFSQEAPEAYPVTVQMICIPQNSPKQEKALEFVEHYIRYIDKAEKTEKMSMEAEENLEAKSRLLTDAETTEEYREKAARVVYSHWNYDMICTKKISKGIMSFAAGSISAEQLAGIMDEDIASGR